MSERCLCAMMGQHTLLATSAIVLRGSAWLSMELLWFPCIYNDFFVHSVGLICTLVVWLEGIAWILLQQPYPTAEEKTARVGLNKKMF